MVAWRIALTPSGSSRDTAMCPIRSPESSGSIRLRHPVAPDLVLRGNGALELPLGQSLKSGEALPVASTRKRWAVGLLILLGIALYVFVSLGLVSTIISD